jgi:hypothetical protein
VEVQLELRDLFLERAQLLQALRSSRDRHGDWQEFRAR